MASLIAFTGPLVAAIVLVPLRSQIETSSLALIMVVVVVVSVTPGYRGTAVIAGPSAGIWFDFFLTQPYESFTIHRSADIQTTVLLTVVAVIVGEIAARRRHARTDSAVARQEMLAVYVVSEMLSAGTDSTLVIDVIAGHLRELLFLTRCDFEAGVDIYRSPYIDRAGELQDGRFDWRLERNGLPNKDVILPVDYLGHRLGHYLLRGPELGVPLSHDRRLAAVALSDLAGVTLGPIQPNPFCDE
jgi:hypothetical protein